MYVCVVRAYACVPVCLVPASASVCVGKGSSQWLELRTVYHHVFNLALDQSVCPLFIKERLDDA